ncbi:MAG: hypothetical protein ACXVX7_00560 [Mycobacterium sp.]
MANGAKVALAVGAGYLLGRTRKMRFALMLAGAGMTGKFPAKPADVLAYGLKSLGGSAELGQLTEQLRGEVLGAARSAALTAVTHQVDSLNDRLQGVTSAVGADEVLDDVGGTVGDTADEVGVNDVLDGVGSTVGDTVGVVGRRRKTRSEDDEYLDEDAVDDRSGYEEDEEPFDVDEADEDFDEDVDDLDETDIEEQPEPEEEEPRAPVRRRRATRQATAPRKSLRRSARAASHEEPSARAARHGRTTTGSTSRRGR